ncbi:uncharacterized protein LOC144196571 [Stigmatopora nigra]
MCKITMLRELMKQRLNLAVEEIFELFERTIMEYEEELNRTKEKNEQQGQLLDAVLKSRAIEQQEQEDEEEEDEKMWAQGRFMKVRARKRRKLQSSLIEDEENANCSCNVKTKTDEEPWELASLITMADTHIPWDSSCVGYIAPLSDSEFEEPTTIKDQKEYVSINLKKEQLHGSQSTDKLTPPITMEDNLEQWDGSTLGYITPMSYSDEYVELPKIKYEKEDVLISPKEEVLSNQSVEKLTPPITKEDTGEQRDGSMAHCVGPPSELDKIEVPKLTSQCKTEESVPQPAFGELLSIQSADKLTPPITTVATGQQRVGSTAKCVTPSFILDKIELPELANAWNEQNGGDKVFSLHQLPAVPQPVSGELLSIQSVDKLTLPITMVPTGLYWDGSTKKCIAPSFILDQIEAPKLPNAWNGQHGGNKLIVFNRLPAVPGQRKKLKRSKKRAPQPAFGKILSIRSVDKLTLPITTVATGQQRVGSTAKCVAPSFVFDKIEVPKLANAWNGQHGSKELIFLNQLPAVPGQCEKLTPSRPASDVNFITCLLCMKRFLTTAHLIAHSKMHANDKWAPVVKGGKTRMLLFDCRKKKIFCSNVVYKK